MADIADQADAFMAIELEARIAATKAEMQKGNPGECNSCGEWSERLVLGDCASCRDRQAKHLRITGGKV